MTSSKLPLFSPMTGPSAAVLSVVEPPSAAWTAPATAHASVTAAMIRNEKCADALWVFKRDLPKLP
jgi:hypothetical protein